MQIDETEKLDSLNNKLLFEHCAVIFDDCDVYCEHPLIWIWLVEEAVLKFVFQLQLE